MRQYGDDHKTPFFCDRKIRDDDNDTYDGDGDNSSRFDKEMMTARNQTGSVDPVDAGRRTRVLTYLSQVMPDSGR